MSAPKNYTVAAMVTAADQPEIDALLKQHPLWKLKHAREAVARRNFARRLKPAPNKNSS
jgi:hypothetical protein